MSLKSSVRCTERQILFEDTYLSRLFRGVLEQGSQQGHVVGVAGIG